MTPTKAQIKSRNMAELAEYRRYLNRHPDLKCLFIELTDRCNLYCRHCGSSCSGAGSTFIDTDLICRTIREAGREFEKSHFMICLTGGEPMLHPDFEKIVEAINESRIPWGMTTNATLIDDAQAKKLRDLGMGSISISLDGLREDHEWMRRVPGSFDRTVEGIKALQRAGHQVQVTTAVNKRNKDKLDDIYAFLLSLGVDSWRLISVDPIGRANEAKELVLSEREIVDLLRYIRNKRFSQDTTIDVCFSCQHYLSFELEREVRDFYFECGAGTSIMSVLCNGDIFGCLDIERRPELVQGNIGRDSLFDVWNNRFEIYRRDRTRECGKCSLCPEKEYCGGDSLHTWDFDRCEPRICLRETIKNAYHT